MAFIEKEPVEPVVNTVVPVPPPPPVEPVTTFPLASIPKLLIEVPVAKLFIFK